MADTTTACSSELDLYKDVDFCKGQRILPGMRAYMMMIKRSNIVTFPKLPGDKALTLEEVTKLIGDFVLSADKKFSKIDLVPNETEFKFDSIGQYGSKLIKNTVEVLIPGMEEKVSGLVAQLNNDDCIFLIAQRNGKFRLVGNEEFKCELAISGDSGKKSEDSNATKVTITIDDEVPCPFYPGKIETNDGNISGADGTPIVVTP